MFETKIIQSSGNSSAGLYIDVLYVSPISLSSTKSGKENIMKNLKTLLTVFAAMLIMLTPSLLLGTPAYLIALSNPTLALSAAAPSILSNFVSPLDEFGFGIPFVDHEYAWFWIPQELAEDQVYPNNMLLIDYTGSNSGNGGLVYKFKFMGMPAGAAAHINRDNRNGFNSGLLRGDLFGPGATFFADITTSVSVAPGIPSNLFDIGIGVMPSSRMSLGFSGGWAHDKTFEQSDEIDGTADSTTDQESKGNVYIGRFGGSYYADGWKLDLRAAAHLGRYEATYKSEANAVPANEDDSITAKNTAWAIGGRFTYNLTDKLDLLGIFDYQSIPQNYDAEDDGSSIDSTTARVDDTKFNTWGVGLGANLRYKVGGLIHGDVQAINGKGTYTEEGPGPGTRPEDEIRWWTLGANLGATVPVLPRLELTGAVGHSKTWTTDERDRDTGLSDVKSSDFSVSTDAALGLRYQFLDPVTLDFVMNLDNFTSAGALGGLSLRTSMIVDF